MPKTYSDQDVERALQARAITSSASEAAHVLSESFELTIPPRTISEWVANSHRDRYEQIRAEIAPKIHMAVASEMEDIAVSIVQVQRDAVERVKAELPKMDGKDAALALKSLSAAGAAATDKALLLRGRPTQITGHDNPSDVYAALKRLGYTITVEGPETVESTAEEVEEAQLAEGDMPAGYETLECEHGAEHRSECPTCSPEL